MTQTIEERIKKAVEDIVECMDADWEDFSIDKNGDDDEPTNFIVDPAEFMTEVITELVIQNTADTLERVREKTFILSPSMDSENYSDSVTELDCFQDGFDDAVQQMRAFLTPTPVTDDLKTK